ncbi:hypothetical protein Fmac_010530 [Flemingia macrophylla]|uniref:Uncharacterized protein n=1 Tax=Flemingia macrophylla TaxID=520843 RepID=A0ABD1MJV2_9FABA
MSEEHRLNKSFQEELTILKLERDKESEELDKMDEEIKIIEELRDSNNYLGSQVSHIERT